MNKKKREKNLAEAVMCPVCVSHSLPVSLFIFTRKCSLPGNHWSRSGFDTPPIMGFLWGSA